MSLLLETYPQYEAQARQIVKDYYGEKIPSVLPGDVNLLVGRICMSLDSFNEGLYDKESMEMIIKENLEGHDELMTHSE